MFTIDQLDEIDGMLQAGLTPEQVADRLGMTYSQLRLNLSKTGRIIRIYRRLEVASPADEPRELAAA